MKTSIKIRTQFEFVHCWKDAPEEVQFLRYLHRHDFLVSCEIEVFHNDRELEFFMVLHRLEHFIEAVMIPNCDVTTSCEQFAQQIFQYLIDTYGKRKIKVEVSEDGKSSAIVEE